MLNYTIADIENEEAILELNLEDLGFFGGFTVSADLFSDVDAILAKPDPVFSSASFFSEVDEILSASLPKI